MERQKSGKAKRVCIIYRRATDSPCEQRYCRDYADSRRWNTVAALGFSTPNGQEKVLNKMLQLARAHAFDILLIANLSRLGTIRDMILIADTCQRAGIKICRLDSKK